MLAKLIEQKSLSATAIAFVAFAPMAEAQMIGSVGLTFGVDNVQEIDDPCCQDEDTAPFGGLTFNGIMPAGANADLAIDATVRMDNFSSPGDFDDTEDPGTEATLGLHYLYDMGNNARAGVFWSYGMQWPQDNDSDDAYNVWLLGVEAQADLGPDLLAYGQLAVGDSTQGEDLGEGFQSGFVVRGGVVKFMNDRSAITLDTQFASTPGYIDDDDPGRFFQVSIGGESLIGNDRPIVANYGLTWRTIDSTDESDHLREIEIYAGLSYLFGATNPRESWRNGYNVGAPTLPTRAVSWTEWAD